MCEFSYLKIGEIWEVTITGSYCNACHTMLDVIKTNVVYKGHITQGIVYDRFDYVSKQRCPYCNTQLDGYIKACREGGSWNLADMKLKETADEHTRIV